MHHDVAHLTAAIIGAGNIGRTHATAYREAGIRAVAVCDVDGGRATALADSLGATPYTNLEHMLDMAHPSAVSVCVPPAGHQAAAEAAAARGIPFLCEKPLAHTLEAAEAILAAAEAAKVVCMIGFCHRFHPPVLAIKRLLDAGEIGTPVFFRNRFAGQFAGVERTWFADRAISGGGTLMDTSIHSLDLYRFLVGEITQVAAGLSTHLAGVNVEDSSVLLVNGPAGVPGVIEASWITPAGGSILTIYGTRGTLTVDYGAGNFGIPSLQLASEQAPRQVPYGGPDRFTAEISHFMESVATGRAPSPSGRDGVRALQVIAAAYAVGTGAFAAVPL